MNALPIICIIGSLFIANADIYDELETANKQWMKHYHESNWENLANLYTDDCKLLPSKSPVLFGKEAVKNMFSGAKEAGIDRIELHILEAYDMDNMAYERSHYVFKTEDGGVADEGKYTVFWKKISNEWRLHSDMFSSNINIDDISKLYLSQQEVTDFGNKIRDIWTSGKCDEIVDIFNDDIVIKFIDDNIKQTRDEYIGFCKKIKSIKVQKFTTEQVAANQFKIYSLAQGILENGDLDKIYSIETHVFVDLTTKKIWKLIAANMDISKHDEL